jgi:hypothetical protein
MRGSVVCLIAPSTFLTSLGLIEAAMIRTKAALGSTAGATTSANSSTEGSPKVSNCTARMTGSFQMTVRPGRRMGAHTCAEKPLRIPPKPRAIHFCSLEAYLDGYIKADGICEEDGSPLFRSAIGRTGMLTRIAMHRVDAWHMIQRRAASAGLIVHVGKHSFRATGITACLNAEARWKMRRPWTHTKVRA